MFFMSSQGNNKTPTLYSASDVVVVGLYIMRPIKG